MDIQCVDGQYLLSAYFMVTSVIALILSLIFAWRIDKRGEYEE